MGKWWYYLLGGAAAGLGVFIYLTTRPKKGGDPDQLAAARQARIDKLNAEKVESQPVTNGEINGDNIQG